MFKKLFFLSLFSMQGFFVQAQEVVVETSNVLSEAVVETKQPTYESPEDFVNSFIDESFNFLNSLETQKLSVKEREEGLIELSRKYFGTKKICKLVLAKHFRKFNEDQFLEFCTYLEIVMVRTVNSQMKDISKDTIDNTLIKFKVNTTTRKNKTIHSVSGFVTLKDREPIEVKLGILEEESVYKIFSVTVLDLNLIRNYREVYGSMISKHKSMDGFLSDFKEKIEN